MSGRGKSKCQGPEAEASLVCSDQRRRLVWLKWREKREEPEQVQVERKAGGLPDHSLHLACTLAVTRAAGGSSRVMLCPNRTTM